MTVAHEALPARAIDDVAPKRIERPRDAGEVAAILRGAHEAREAVVLWGGGTRIAVGDAPTRYDAAVELAGVSGVVEHSPADLVCTVRAGTTLAALSSELGRSGQRWPVEVPDPDRATVGGTIASATAGPSRLRFQHPRDWVIGCEAVLGDGTRARAGGRVVKNVTGFDLTRLYSGSYGTLAALVEVSLKLVARDETTRSFVLADADVGRVAAIALELRAALPLDTLVLVTGAEGASLHVRVAGTAAAVERLAAELARRGVTEESTLSVWAALVARTTSDACVARCAVAPGTEPTVIGASGLAYVGTGVAYRFGATREEIAALRVTCERAGGALVVERATPAMRRSLGTWGAPRVPSAVARGLKERFDPRGVLAPGRFPV